MEHIYLKENACWASEKEIHIESYFNDCRTLIQEISNEDGGDSKCKLNLKNSYEVASFVEDKKSCLKSPYAVSIYTMFPKLEIPTFDVTKLHKSFITNRRYEFQSECIKSAFRQNNQKRKERCNQFRMKMNGFLKYVDYMSANHIRGQGFVSNQVTPYSEILLEVQIFNTSPHSGKWCLPQANQMFQILGSQPLTVLTERIRCVNNYTDVAGDVSDNLDTPATSTIKNSIKSSMLYLGNAFYIDGDTDYSKVVQAWGERKKLALGGTYDMKSTSFKDLSIRLNYPYLFQHLGDCEHTVIFTEVRFLESADEPSLSSYPIVRDYEDSNFQRCYVCANYLARWIVHDSDRLVYEYNALCDNCFRKYHYVGGKKVGQFEAYRILLDLNGAEQGSGSS